jgi:hypothetical protein
MLDDEPAGAVDDHRALDRLAEFCIAGKDRIGVDAMTVTVANSFGNLELLYATNDLAERVAQIGFALGQGPSFDARSTGVPTMADDLAGSISAHRWPLFAPEAVHAGIRGLHAYPMNFPAGAIGTVGLYSRTPCRLSTEQFRQAEAITELIGLSLIDPNSSDTIGMGLRMTVHQAAGMVMQQTGTTIQDALVLLRSTAFTEDVQMTALAAEVINGKRRFREVGKDDDE